MKTKKTIVANENVNVKKELKTTKRTEDEKKILNTRINLLLGQLKGVQAMIENDRYIDDVMIQLLAVDKAIKSIANIMIKKHLFREVLKSEDPAAEKTVNELMTIVTKFQD